jgi:hypothetical protein
MPNYTLGNLQTEYEISQFLRCLSSLQGQVPIPWNLWRFLHPAPFLNIFFVRGLAHEIEMGYRLYIWMMDVETTYQSLLGFKQKKWIS